MVRWNASCLALAWALVAAPVAGQLPDAVQDVWRRVDQTLAHQAMARRGSETYFGSLRAGASETIEGILTLVGSDVRLVGLCDGDCSDLDLTIMYADGQEIDSDVGPDAVPVVDVAPEDAAPSTEVFGDPTGLSEYQARVDMVACSVEPCMWTFAVYHKLWTLKTTGDPVGALWKDTRRGELGAGDDKLDGGEFFDAYEYEASPSPGRMLTVSVESSEFDTYVVVQSPSGEIFTNDDFEGSTNRSQVEVPITERGVWRAVATSFEGGETGSYELTVSLAIPTPQG